MKSTFITLAAAVLIAAFGIDAARAQSTALIHHRIVKTNTALNNNNAPSMGRDFWFAAPSNQWGIEQIGTFKQIYITSSSNCTAYVSSQYVGGVPGSTTEIAVKAYETSTYTIPEFWEMESSGIPDNKAIHVYCDSADLSVYFMSSQFQSGDGSYIIPTIGWGMDYVVAAYGSLFASDGGEGTYDLPSECMIVASQDNTIFEFTPSCDCRQCYGGNFYGDTNSKIVVYPQGATQTFQLNRGQCMQFMPVQASDDSNFDMSGTIIHANQPVGVLGASQDPEIPAGFSSPNFVCEMMPPVRTWGETYYAANPIQPPGENNKDFARYLFISTMDSQTIVRRDAQTGTHIECVIPNRFGIFWDELELGQKIYSNAPFLCAWYLNGATYPDGVQGLGDPAECTISPKEQYTKSILFQTPVPPNNDGTYDDFANIIVNVNDAKNVLFDEKGILGYAAQPNDGQWEVFNIPHIAPGVHTITNSDSGVGAYIYGYGNNKSYAWGTPSSCGTFNSPDTIPPLADTLGQCFNAFVHVVDSGLLPDSLHQQSGLSMIRLDSSSNMNYNVDNNFIEGSGVDTSGYTMNVINPDEPATLVVSIYDFAGNVTTITSVYEPAIVSIKPPIQNLGVTLLGSVVPNIKFDTIFNTGQVAFDFGTLKLLKGDVGFTIFDSIGGPLDLSPLDPGQHRLIMIKFLAIGQSFAVDSIIFGNACFTQAVALIGGDGASDFLVTSQDWINVPVPAPAGGYVRTVTIENLSTVAITIDSEWWRDQIHFQAVPGQLPITIPKSPGSGAFRIAYFPDSNSLTTPDRTQGKWFSDSVKSSNGSLIPEFDSLIGNGAAPSETFLQSIDTTFDCVSMTDTATAYFTITATGTANSYINLVTQSDTTDFFNLLGTVNGSNATWNPKTQAQELTPGQTATISVQYVVPDSTNETLVDHLRAINGTGETIGDTALNLTVHVTLSAATTNPVQLQFGPVNFQTQNANTTQRVFFIQNVGTLPLPIDFLVLDPGGPFNAAFSFTTTPPCPDTLQAGQSMTVTVDFNDSINDAPVQTALLEIVGDMCNELIDTLTGTIANSGVKEGSPMMIAPSLNATIIPAEDCRSLEIILPTSLVGAVNFSLVNVLGESVLRSTFSVGAQTLDASSLPRGVYFYRLTSGQMSQSGKVILGE